MNINPPGQATQPVPLPRGGSPYRGLDAFQEDDSDYFFGRADATKKVLSKLAERLVTQEPLVLSGASGAGKSSLLQAGVLPLLRKHGLSGAPTTKPWPCLTFTPTSQPLDMLAIQVAGLIDKDSVAVRGALAKDPKAFALFAREAVHAQLKGANGHPGRLILVIDQFEQLFTSCADEGQRRAFIDALHAAASSPGQGQAPAALVVLGVRADFETQCAQYSQLTDAIQHRYLLPPMTGRELRNVITGPAEQAGLRIEAGLTEQLLKEMGAADTTGTVPGLGVLPLLSHALDQTWRVHKGNSLTLADYEKTGGIEQAVERSAADAYDSLTEPQQKIARQVFVMLTSVTADDMVTANPRTRADLSECIAGAQDDDLAAVLNAFAQDDRRLLTLSTDSVAIAHEVLIQAWPLLRDDWLAEDRDNRKILTTLHKAADDWAANLRSHAYLYTGSRLEAAVTATDHIKTESARYPHLSHNDEDFLTASRRLERHSIRLRHRVTAGLIALVVLLAASTIGVVLALSNVNAARNTANSERDAFTSEALDAQSQGTGDSTPVPSLQKALAAWAIKHTNSVADYTVLDEAANFQWNAELAIDGSSEGWATFSPNGEFLAVRTDDGTHLWDVAEHKELTTYPNGNGLAGLSTVAFSPNGKCLAAVSNKVIELLKTASRYTGGCGLDNGVGSLSGGNEDPNEAYNSVAISPQGNLVAADADDGIRIWDSSGKNQPVLLPVSATVPGSVTFSPNGKYLAVTTGSGVELWNVSTLWSIGVPAQPAASFSVGNDGLTQGAPTFSPDGPQLAVAVETFNSSGVITGATVPIWNTESAGQKPTVLDIGSGAVVYSAEFSPDGGLLAAATSNGVQLWDTDQQAGSLTDQQTSTLAPPNDVTVYQAAFSPNGQDLAAASSNGVWLADPVTDSFSSSPQYSFRDNDGSPVSAVALNPDGSLLVMASSTGEIQVVNTGTRSMFPLRQSGDSDFVYSVAFSRNGDLLAAATSSGVLLWHTATLREKNTATLLASKTLFGQVAFSPNGEYLAGVSSNSIQVWNTGNLKQHAHSLAVPKGNGYASVAFSPSSKLLVASSDNENGRPGAFQFYTGAIQEWKTGTFSPTVSLPQSNDDPDFSLTFNPDGSLLAVGGNGTTQLLNPATLKQAMPSINGLPAAFSPDGLVIGVEDGNEIELRDIDTGQVVNTLRVTDGLVDPGPASLPIAFSANGNELAAMAAIPELDPTPGQASSGVELWDVSYLGASLDNTVSYLCNQLSGQYLTRAEWSKDAPGVSYKNACS